jgi:hypothetical protein
VRRTHSSFPTNKQKKEEENTIFKRESSERRLEKTEKEMTPCLFGCFCFSISSQQQKMQKKQKKKDLKRLPT